MELLLEIAILAGLNALLFVCIQRKIMMQVIVQHQQLAVYKRSVKKLKIKERDRIFWMMLSIFWSEWKSRLIIVKPETILRWNRRRFKDYWKIISRPKCKAGRPKIDREHVDFIRKISAEHPEYGAERIAGILKENFGVDHAASTVDKYRVKHPKPPRGTQQWSTFLKNHASAIWCCDFVVQFTFFFVPIYIFIIMELSSRKIVHFRVTKHPTLPWVKNQIRHATPWGECPRFIIHDNDGIFGQHRVTIINETTGRLNTYRSSLDFWLSEVMDSKGIPIPYGAPNANACQERLNGTLIHECLDHMIIFNERHLHRILNEYIAWFNHARYHQGIEGIPEPYPELQEEKPEHGKIIAIPVLGGLHHDYRLAA